MSDTVRPAFPQGRDYGGRPPVDSPVHQSPQWGLLSEPMQLQQHCTGPQRTSNDIADVADQVGAHA